MKFITTYSIGILILLAIFLPRAAHSYDPPEVFAVFTGENEVLPFANDFCWIEDQNGDGCDELLINNIPVNQAWFYWGGEDMDNNPDITFSTNIDHLELGIKVLFLGNIIPDHNPFITLEARLRDGGHFGNLYLYEAGEDIDNNVDFILSTPHDGEYSGVWSSSGRLNRPADLNGDGYHDIIVKEKRDNGHDDPLTVYFGGAEFDTIPDWRINNYPWNVYRSFISGFDINGDGYDDIFVHGELQEGPPHYYFFLGGDPMDTTVAFDFGVEGYECEAGPAGIGDIIMLQDVNDDGYDDWAACFSDPGTPYDDDYTGKFIFFGSEEPDLEPDLELEGIHHGWVRGDGGDMAGGDFNGDGIGDIVVGASDRAIGDYGEVCIYFGSRWMDGGSPDIMIRNRDDGYEDFSNLGCWIGASGDYNGDGVDDIVVKSQGGREWIYQLIIMLGNEDWVVGVDEADVPEEYKLSLETAPNPFNNQVTISYQVSLSCNVRLSVYDVQGRLVEQLEDSLEIRGDHKLTWHAQTSGIYLVLLQTETASIVKKVVCLK